MLKKLFALLMVALLLVGCTTTGTDTGKKVLKIGKDVELTSMDPQVMTDGLSFEVLAATVEGLYQLDKDGVPYLAMATSVDKSADGLTYTYKLRDAKWDNGDPVTADDFVFAWQRLCDPALASEYNFMVQVAALKNADAILAGTTAPTELGVTAVDEKTLKVELTLPIPFFDSLMAFPVFYPVNRKFFTEKGAQFGLTPETALANGPWKLKTWDQGNSWTLEKNPTYYDADKIKIDAIEYKVIKDAQTGVLEFESGKVDFVKLTGELVAQYKDNAAFVNTLEGYLWYMSFSFGNDRTGNVNLRKAVSYAIDREKIANNVLKDGSIPAAGFIPRKFATGPDGKDYRDTTDVLVGLDREKAKQFWAEAQKELGDKVTVELLFEDTEASKGVAEFIQSELESTLPGLTVTLKSQPKKQRLALMRDQTQYEIGLTRWGPDYADPMTYLDLLKSTNTKSGFVSEEYDAIIIDAASGELATKPVERWEALKGAEALLITDLQTVAPVYQSGQAALVSTKIQGLESHTVGVPFIYHRVTLK